MSDEEIAHALEQCGYSPHMARNRIRGGNAAITEKLMKLPSVPSEGFLQAIQAEERKKLGKAGMTKAEAQAVYARGQEKDLKKVVLNELLRQGAWVFDQPMSKRTRGRPGVPDILGCYRGAFFAVELKASGQPLRQDQAQEAVAIRKSMGRFCLAYCLNDVTEMLLGILADDR